VPHYNAAGRLLYLSHLLYRHLRHTTLWKFAVFFCSLSEESIGRRAKPPAPLLGAERALGPADPTFREGTSGITPSRTIRSHAHGRDVARPFGAARPRSHPVLNLPCSTAALIRETCHDVGSTNRCFGAQWRSRSGGGIRNL